mmetsp:Transcript_4611/g.9613  ORF Transcript_4611/g.9613 Transcript_4611/m.9613 type:complete len:141 (+) Transcript_4611:724-1146(+)
MGQLVVQLLVVAQCFEGASANASAGVDHHRGVAAVEERVPPEQVPEQYLFGCIGAVEVDGVAAAAALGARVEQEQEPFVVELLVGEVDSEEELSSHNFGVAAVRIQCLHRAAVLEHYIVPACPEDAMKDSFDMDVVAAAG